MKRACSIIDAVDGLSKHVFRVVLIQVKDVIGLEGKGNFAEGLSYFAEELLVAWLTRFFEGLLTSHSLLLFTEFVHDLSFDFVIGDRPESEAGVFLGNHLKQSGLSS